MTLQLKTLMPSERIRAVERQIETQGSIRVEEAAMRFGVSMETVRRDLKQLSADGRAKLVRGGAVRVERSRPLFGGRRLPSVDQRALANEAEKNDVGRRAADLVQDGQVVLLDGGTTTLAAARHLRAKHHLTIITNNLMIVQEVSGMANWRIHVIGGELSPTSMSLVGLSAIRGLQQTAADIAFLGAAGVSPAYGFTSPDPLESELKKSMIAIARTAVVVADHSKMLASGFAPFAALSDIDVFVTSMGVDDEALEGIRKSGAQVIIAQRAEGY